MDTRPGFWDKSGRTIALIRIDEVAAWIKSEVLLGRSQGVGPWVAGLFLSDANTPTEEYVKKYLGPLALVPFEATPRPATHFTYLPVQPGDRQAANLALFTLHHIFDSSESQLTQPSR